MSASHCVELPIPAAHPSYEGHFPDQPILPGVVLLAELLEAMRGDAASRAWLGPTPQLTMAKFVAPVRPGQRLWASWQLPAAGARRARFEIHAEAAHAAAPWCLVASGQLEGGADPAAQVEAVPTGTRGEGS